MRKQFSGEFKAKVAIAAIKGEKTIAELCSEYEVHANRISAWKRIVQEGLPGLFKGRGGEERAGQELTDNLYKNIGQLQVENEWLKKKLVI